MKLSQYSFKQILLMFGALVLVVLCVFGAIKLISGVRTVRVAYPESMKDITQKIVNSYKNETGSKRVKTFEISDGEFAEKSVKGDYDVIFVNGVNSGDVVSSAKSRLSIRLKNYLKNNKKITIDMENACNNFLIPVLADPLIAISVSDSAVLESADSTVDIANKLSEREKLNGLYVGDQYESEKTDCIKIADLAIFKKNIKTVQNRIDIAPFSGLIANDIKLQAHKNLIEEIKASKAEVALVYLSELPKGVVGTSEVFFSQPKWDISNIASPIRASLGLVIPKKSSGSTVKFIQYLFSEKAQKMLTENLNGVPVIKADEKSSDDHRFWAEVYESCGTYITISSVISKKDKNEINTIINDCFKSNKYEIANDDITKIVSQK